MERTADYILDAVGGGLRATAVRISNCAATEIDMAIKEIVATQGQNVRAKGSRTYHLVVSFPLGERPAPERLRDIEDELCKAIGLGKHQRLSAVHTDTPHLHMHVAINQVHPQTFACIEPWQDRPKLMRACERLEIKHGLIRTHHGGPKRIDAEPRLPMRAEAMEAHEGVSSFLRWVREEVRPALLRVLENGTGWQEFHAVLREHGLAMRMRGAGLVIAERDGQRMVKASAVDRGLAVQALEKRWGAFVPPDQSQTGTLGHTQKAYRRRPMDRDTEIDELYETFERLRGERQDAKRTLDTELDRRWRNIVVWRDVRFETIFTSRYWSDAGKRLEYSKLEADAAEKFADEKRYATAQRAAFQQSWPPLTWRMFLRNAAMLGNRAALGALRRSQARHHRAVGALVSGDGTPEAKRVIERELRPEVLGHGDVVYRLSDGGRVVDRGAGLEIEKMSDLAALLALSAGAERSANGCVTLPADAAMAAQMIDVAASHRLNVRFTDARHEEARREGVWRSEREDAAMAAAVFAAERAAASSVPYRMWTADDAGAAAFEGLYSLDGAHALLLRKDDTVLVMQVTAAEAAEAGDTTPGASVEVTADGRMARKARAQ